MMHALISLVLLLPYATLHASQIQYGKERLESLQGSGRVVLNETQIVGYVDVNGSLFANGAHLGSASINGQATLYDSTVEGKSVINGSLCAEKCTFRSAIDATAQKVSFTECNLNSIHITKTPWPNGKQVVKLSNCNCRGGIVFDSGDGIVILKNKSLVQGKVVGAVIQKI